MFPILKQSRGAYVLIVIGVLVINFCAGYAQGEKIADRI